MEDLLPLGAVDGIPDNALAVSFQPEFYYFSDGLNSVPGALQLPDETDSAAWEFPAASTTSVSPEVGYAYAQSVWRYENDILNYTAVVSQNDTGSFSSIICEEATINAANQPITNVVDDGSVLATACAQGTEVK
ncbi:hypothetical protein Xen7305DRAFT_00010340 [Xenococcus sp. PCC 7305]|uniref:hypothetical protein n=1 Tax=Xenococcus sp. PCC 7305 TaxID=102125 RepID=UPI0002AC6BE5|nr:hypothetical protein [Xenococcus sp. PCC 7305]ELS01331.1 hypothetical protein Xen7305DRAFT_00010340 [Xenococcus sp. PCC 7305]